MQSLIKPPPLLGHAWSGNLLKYSYIIQYYYSDVVRCCEWLSGSGPNHFYNWPILNNWGNTLHTVLTSKINFEKK